MENIELAGRKKMKRTGIYFLIFGTVCFGLVVLSVPYIIKELSQSSVGFFQCLYAGPHPSDLWRMICYFGYTIAFGLHGLCCILFSNRFDRSLTCLITFFVSIVLTAGMFYIEATLVSPGSFDISNKKLIIIAIILYGVPMLINLIGIIQNMSLMRKGSR